MHLKGEKIMNGNIKIFHFLLFIIVFFISWGGTFAKEEIPGILIEGTDYAGKSTVCEALNNKLTAQKTNIHFGHCCISNSSVVKFLWQKAREEKNILKSSWLRTATGIIDNTLFQPSSRTFYIQDRNWLSNHCRMEFFHPGAAFMSEAYIVKKHKSLNVIFILLQTLKLEKRDSKEEPKKMRLIGIL